MVNWRKTKVIHTTDRKSPGAAELDLIDQTDIIASASDGDFLTWVASASAWEGVAPISVGATAVVSNLSSVQDVVGGVCGNILQYDGFTWNPVDLTSVITTASVVGSGVTSIITHICDTSIHLKYSSVISI